MTRNKLATSDSCELIFFGCSISKAMHVFHEVALLLTYNWAQKNQRTALLFWYGSQEDAFAPSLKFQPCRTDTFSRNAQMQTEG